MIWHGIVPLTATTEINQLTTIKCREIALADQSNPFHASQSTQRLFILNCPGFCLRCNTLGAQALKGCPKRIIKDGAGKGYSPKAHEQRSFSRWLPRQYVHYCLPEPARTPDNSVLCQIRIHP